MILESTDGGMSWTQAVTPSFTGSIGVFEFAPSDSAVVYAGTATACVHNDYDCSTGSASGVLVSSNGGTNWSLAVDVDLADAVVTDIAVDPTRHRLRLGGNPRGRALAHRRRGSRLVAGDDHRPHRPPSAGRGG